MLGLAKGALSDNSGNHHVSPGLSWESGTQFWGKKEKKSCLKMKCINMNHAAEEEAKGP